MSGYIETASSLLLIDVW